MRKTMEFVCEAPLQAWGAASTGNIHNVSEVPGKKSIIGMIAACMGLPRNDQRISELNSKVDVLVTEVRGTNDMLLDFHTVSGLPFNGTEFSGIKANCLYGKEGNGKQNATITKRKYYTQNASYTVQVTCEDELANEIFDAMSDPVWPAYLGRKCCIPTVPVVPVWKEG